MPLNTKSSTHRSGYKWNTEESEALSNGVQRIMIGSLTGSALGITLGMARMYRILFVVFVLFPLHVDVSHSLILLLPFIVNSGHSVSPKSHQVRHHLVFGCRWIFFWQHVCEELRKWLSDHLKAILYFYFLCVYVCTFMQHMPTYLTTFPHHASLWMILSLFQTRL